MDIGETMAFLMEVSSVQMGEGLFLHGFLIGWNAIGFYCYFVFLILLL